MICVTSACNLEQASERMKSVSEVGAIFRILSYGLFDASIEEGSGRCLSRMETTGGATEKSQFPLRWPDFVDFQCI